MSDAKTLADLVSLWQRGRAEGKDLPATELCGDRADLVPTLERQLHLLRQMNRLMDSTADTPPPAAPPGALTVPAPTLGDSPTPPVAAYRIRDWAPPGYEILGELGRGGMAVVYKARQAELGRLTALKVILAGPHASDFDLARLRAEAQAIACFQHPNIVQIYEVGEHHGLPFLALEFCPGDSLAHKMREGPLRPVEAARLVEVVARAVQASHDKGIIHRDLKPGNILLAGDGSPKISDFGLAKKLDAPSSTVTGAVLGTPSYMAPEQACGNTDAIGPLSDVYALGAVLYDCLTGRPPFRAVTSTDTLLQVLHSEPVAPHLLQPDTPRDLDVICLRCLQKDPARRYANAGALADDLGRFLAGVPILARPVGAGERAWRWCRRNPGTAALLATVAATLLLGTIVSTTLAFVAAGNAHRAQVSEGNALAQKARAEEERERAEWLLYASQVGRALRDWEGNHVEDARRHLAATGDGFRGWEYRYLRRLFAGSQQTLLGHTDRVNAVHFASDGRLVSGGSDKMVRVWDPASGRQRLALPAPAVVTAVCFSPDGKRLAGGGADGGVWLWSAGGGEPAALGRHDGEVIAAAFSPDSLRLATAGADRTVRVWDVGGGKPLTLTGHEGIVTAVAFAPDGSLLSASDDRTVRVWDPVRGGRSKFLLPTAHDSCVTALALSRDGKQLATAGEDEVVRLWGMADGRRRLTLRGHAGRVNAVCFSPDDGRLASAGADGTVRLWDLDGEREAVVLKGHDGSVTGLGFAPDGSRLATAGADATVRLWETDRSQGPLVYRGHRDVVLSACVSPDGRRVASAGADDTLRVWDAATGAEALRLDEPNLNIFDVVFSPDGRLLAGGSDDDTVRLWDAATGRGLPPLRGHAPAGAAPAGEVKTIESVRFSPDGKRLAGGSAAGGVLVWDVGEGRQLFALGGAAEVKQVAFHPDGRRLAAAGEDGVARVWDLATGEEVLTLKGPGGALSAVCYRPDGRRIAAAARSGSVRVWDAETGAELLTFPAEGPISGLTFSADGTRLIGSVGKAVRVWVAATGLPVLTLVGHEDDITGLSLGGGTRLATAGRDRTVRVWSAADPD